MTSPDSGSSTAQYPMPSRAQWNCHSASIFAACSADGDPDGLKRFVSGSDSTAIAARTSPGATRLSRRRSVRSSSGSAVEVMGRS